MATEYKVWVQIESADYDNDRDYQDVSELRDIGRFSTLEEAQAFMDSLEEGKLLCKTQNQ